MTGYTDIEAPTTAEQQVSNEDKPDVQEKPKQISKHKIRTPKQQEVTRKLSEIRMMRQKEMTDKLQLLTSKLSQLEERFTAPQKVEPTNTSAPPKKKAKLAPVPKKVKPEPVEESSSEEEEDDNDEDDDSEEEDPLPPPSKKKKTNSSPLPKKKSKTRQSPAELALRMLLENPNLLRELDNDDDDSDEEQPQKTILKNQNQPAKQVPQRAPPPKQNNPIHDLPRAYWSWS